MNCPNCGAPIEGDKCGYCGYTLLNIIDFEPGKVCGGTLNVDGKEYRIYTSNPKRCNSVDGGKTLDRNFVWKYLEKEAQVHDG